MKKFDLMAGSLGNGITVFNRAVEVSGDYQKVAHIDSKRRITWYLKNPPESVSDFVNAIADGPNQPVSSTQTDQFVFEMNSDEIRLLDLERRCKREIHEYSQSEKDILEAAVLAKTQKELEELVSKTKIRTIQDYIILKGTIISNLRISRRGNA